MNLAGALLATAGHDPDRPALRIPTGAISYGDLARRAAALRLAIGQRASPGDRVAIAAGNEVSFVVAYLATLAAGAVAVALNPTAPAAELARDLGMVKPSLLVASPTYEGLAQECAPSRPILVVGDDDASDTDVLAPVDRVPSDPAALLFTSGTAGAPRPAILTHGSLLANLEQVQQHAGLALRPDDVGLAVLPCFHIFGLNVALGVPLFAGASISLIEHFHPADALRRVRDDGVTMIAAVPAIYDAWLALDANDAPPDAFARVRLAVSGAAALERDTVTTMQERFGVAVHEGYGLTEASPVVTTSAVDADLKPGSIGPPLPGVEVRLVDSDGADVLAGDPGEIWVRGPNVFAGYWDDDAATQRVLTRDGWLRTGDIAVADDDGWLALVDRAKDLIIVSGFNVFPAEVEVVLLQHPDVREAVVVGEPHPRTGETVVAYVVPAAGHDIDRRDLIRFAQARLARYKLPTRVDVVDAVPRTFGGKIARRVLAERGATRADATTKPM
jgi:long-chain acyl-CoA synthetase